MNLAYLLNALGLESGLPPREVALRLMSGYWVTWLDPYHGIAKIEGIVLGSTTIVDNQCVTSFTFNVYDPEQGYIPVDYCPLQFNKESQ